MPCHNFKFETGIEVKDIITGFVGIIMARANYITGCDRYALQNRKLKDGKPSEFEWFDETCLVPLKGKKKIILVKEEKKPVRKKIETGGPRPNPPKA